MPLANYQITLTILHAECLMSQIWHQFLDDGYKWYALLQDTAVITV